MIFQCPVCHEKLAHCSGTQLDQHLPPEKRDGVTVYCDNLQCSAQEVSGHGRSQAAAYHIIEQRFNYANND